MATYPQFSLCRAGVLASLALALTVAAAGAVETPTPQPPGSNSTLPSPDSVPNLPQRDRPNDPAVQAQPPGCAVWTDRCVACMRMDGAISCSNIGIACQPQAVECLRREPAEEKK